MAEGAGSSLGRAETPQSYADHTMTGKELPDLGITPRVEPMHCNRVTQRMKRHFALGKAACLPYFCIKSQYDQRSKGMPRVEINRYGESSARVRRYACTSRRPSHCIG